MAKRKRKLQNTKKTFTVKVPAANRNYKDTVFRMLFSNRKNLLSLYNAVNQRDYKNPDDLEIVTLENAIYMGMKNDLAFIKVNYDIVISFSRFSLYIIDVLFRVNSVPKCPFISIILTLGNPDLFPDFSIFIFFFSYIKNTCISRCTVSSFHRIMIYHA